jgi:hypothetical protein
MKYILISTILCAAMLSCTNKQKNDTQAGQIQKTEAQEPQSGPFDIGRLTLKEKDLPTLISAQGVKPEHVSDEEQSLLGYEVFKSSSANVLKFNGKDLSGANGSNKNHVLFHYNEKTKDIAFYEIKLYTEAQAAELLKELQKMGKPNFQKVGLNKGEFAIDLNGNPIERGKEEKQAYRVWENKSNGLNYYLGELGSGKDFNAELTVLDPSAKYAKDWISFGSLDWYKHD